MKADEVRGKEDAELEFDLERLRKDLFDMKFRSITEGNPDPARIRRVRRDIARIETILQERRVGVRGQEPR